MNTLLYASLAIPKLYALFPPVLLKSDFIVYDEGAGVRAIFAIS